MAAPPILPPDFHAADVGAGDPGYPRPESEASLSRNPLGWIALVLVFGFLIFTGFARSEKRDPLDLSTASEESALRIGTAIEDLSGNRRQPGLDGKQNLRQLADGLKGKQDARRVYIAAVVARELGRPIDRPALARAARDARVGAARVELVIQDHPAPKAATVKRIEEPRFVDQLAAAQAAERAGVPRAQARGGITDPTIIPRVGIAGLGLFGVGALGLAAWIGYFINRAHSALAPRGEPSLPMAPAQADRFAWRGAGIILAYLIGSLGASLLASNFGTAIGELAQFGILGGLAIYAWTMRGTDEAPMLSARRFRGPGPYGRLLLWGLLAAAANVPLVFLVTLVTSPFLHGAPIPTHPVTETLLPGSPLLEVLKTFLLASVCAPIWEETFFRGILLQGFRGLRWSLVASAALSSFLFASVHPQGFAAWPALATIALMSCALIRHTRSIVPSIVMHVLWNTMILAGTLLIGPILG